MSQDAKTQFIKEHQECLQRFSALLSEHSIEVSGMRALGKIDPLSPPPFHNFRFSIKVGDRVLSTPISLFPEDLHLRPFDEIIPYFADDVKTRLLSVAESISKNANTKPETLMHQPLWEFP